MEHKKGKNVVSLSAIQQPSSKVVLCEPQSYEEAQEIADNLLNKRSIVINLQRVDSHQAKRIVDFLSGTVYAVKDRKSTRLNSSHVANSYAVFCLKKKHTK